MKIEEIKLQMKSKEYEKRDKILNEERVNVKVPKHIQFDELCLGEKTIEHY